MESFNRVVGARARVIEIASSQLGVVDPSPYWQDAFGRVPHKKYAWCGVFALWVLRQAQLTERKWFSGVGFIWCDANGERTKVPYLPTVRIPDVGDVAYFDKPFQHYALVEAVEGSRVHLIAGNTPSVARSSVALSVPVYFSIAPLLGDNDVAF